MLRPLDATLGVPGLPQSATGQTALLTGVNAPAALGRHVAAFPGPRLAAILADSSVLRRVEEQGGRAVFANALTPGYFAEVERGARRHSATTLAALAARQAVLGLEDLLAGRGAAWDVSGDFLAQRAGVGDRAGGAGGGEPAVGGARPGPPLHPLGDLHDRSRRPRPLGVDGGGGARGSTVCSPACCRRAVSEGATSPCC